MIWVELRANNLRYDPGWNLKESVWAPIHKENGGSWPFWNLIEEVSEGDIIFHLTSVGDEKQFIGYSIAANGGHIAQGRASMQRHAWDFTQSVYKADLKDFIAFQPAIRLKDFFRANEQTLREYFEKNKRRKTNKQRLFYVIQRNKLQCLNGAYFSEFDLPLSNLILKNLKRIQRRRAIPANSPTGIAISQLAARIGQQRFSKNVRNNFNHTCCYPGCPVEGDGFLVSGHIARWADDALLRGATSNGLCFCLMHDKAFERGCFTLNKHYEVVLIARNMSRHRWLEELLAEGNGREIKPRHIDPSLEALKAHWIRVGFDSSG